MQCILTKGTIFHNGRYYRKGDTVEMTAEEAARTNKVRGVIADPVADEVPPSEPEQPTAPPEPDELTAEPEQTPEQEAEPEAEPEQPNTEAEAPEPEQPTKPTSKTKGKQ